MLASKVAFITGAGSEHSSTLARALIAAGAKVVIAGRDGVSVARDIDPSGRQATGVALSDISEAAWDEALATCISTFGRPDIVVLGLPIALAVLPLDQISPETFHRRLNDGFVFSALGLGAAIRVLRTAGAPGRIIQVCSDDARTGRPGHAADAAVMGGLLLYAKTAALECAKRNDGIRMNVLLTGEPPVDAQAVAAAVVLLASDGAGFLNGAVLPAGHTMSSLK